MRDLQFLSIYETKRDPNVRVHLPEEMSFPPLLRMLGCWQLRKIPDVSTNIKSLAIGDTMLQEFPESISLWSHLQSLNIYGSLLTKPLLETTSQEFSLATIERIPDWIKDLNGVKFLYIAGCPKLASLPELPRSLRKLTVDNCESLETVCFPFDTPRTEFLYFPNCFKLCSEAKRVITRKSFRAYFPGKEMPAEFHDHRSFGSSLTIRPVICKFRICLVLSPKPDMEEAYFELMFRIRAKGCPSDEDMIWLDLPKIRAEHLLIFHVEFVEHHEEVVFKFSTSSHEVDVTECGVQVLMDETSRRSIGSDASCSEQVSDDGDEVVSDDKSNEFDEPRVIFLCESKKDSIDFGFDHIIHVSIYQHKLGSRSLRGISFDMSRIVDNVDISAKALKSMCNLRFLKIHMTRFDTNVEKLHVPKDMDFPARLRSLHWDLYPRKFLPRTFCPEYLVDLDLGWNQLEKLWEGTQPLANLKKMNLLASMNLKELPDLSTATNLEKLVLRGCSSLVEIPSSIGNLHKLEFLGMDYCTQLQMVPTHFNLASLESVEMVGCWQLRKIPYISTNVTRLTIAETMLEELPRLWSRLETLIIHGSANRSQFKVEKFIKRSGADIEKIPDWIKDLHGLAWLHIIGCPKLALIPELPGTLRGLIVDTCESLETLSFSFDSPVLFLDFPNCFKLDQEARRVITHQSFKASLPGRNVPEEFFHRAIGNLLTIRSDFKKIRICVVVSPKQETEDSCKLLCRICINGFPDDDNVICDFSRFREEHLCIRRCTLHDKEGWLEQNNEVSFEFSTASKNIDIIECGVQILAEETNVSLTIQENCESIREQVPTPEQMIDRRKEFGVPRAKLISQINMYKIFMFFYLFSLLDFDFRCYVVLNFLFTI
ncbi:unnamed protein product [Eruca vesicaria subsp. sativa]|uniref:Disease resistance protein n=1 Tax=Eruca vesicaria subsp. sativa TaxID=29727 RepID=A0ABC8LAZ2_ERUVS|nr:unnamed protein product [Eruca vesicaria subsp. sativa]